MNRTTTATVAGTILGASLVLAAKPSEGVEPFGNPREDLSRVAMPIADARADRSARGASASAAGGHRCHRSPTVADIPPSPQRRPPPTPNLDRIMAERLAAEQERDAPD